jgi:hypothetical protein
MNFKRKAIVSVGSALAVAGMISAGARSATTTFDATHTYKAKCAGMSRSES